MQTQEKMWKNDSPYPLTLDTWVIVRFRDGVTSARGTVRDWHGAGGIDSNWTHLGDPMDIISYREIRLSYAQARALGKLHKRESTHPSEIGETDATCHALVLAGYAKRDGDKYIKVRDLR